MDTIKEAAEAFAKGDASKIRDITEDDFDYLLYSARRNPRAQLAMLLGLILGSQARLDEFLDLCAAEAHRRDDTSSA